MAINFAIDNVIHANFFSFCAMIAIFYWIWKKMNIDNALDENRKKIKAVVDNSENNKTQSYQQLKNIQDELEKLPQDIDDLCKQAADTGKFLAEKIKEEAEHKTEIIKNNAEKTIEYEMKQAKAMLANDVSLASMILAQDNLVNFLENNNDFHQKIILESIEKI